MPRKGDAPPRPAQTHTGRRVTVNSGNSQRTRRAHHSRRVVIPIVTASAAPRQAASHSGQKLSRLCALILDNNAAIADSYGDALQLAVALHDEGHQLASLARSVALAFIQWTSREHRAAELAALAADVGGEERRQWQ